MTLRLIYFAWVREQIGLDCETMPLAQATSLADVLDVLAARGGGYAQALADRSRIRAAVNAEFAGWDQPVEPGDELAIFPPVTGG